jgi:hypothetical protein
MSQFCVSCGTALESQSNFCQKCGHSVPRASTSSVSNTNKQSNSSDQRSRQKMRPLTRNIVFGLVFALLLAGAVNSLRGAEEREACQAISIILGPVNEGPPNVEEFRKTWVVMDALAEETSNLELKAAIKAFSLAGKTMLSQQISTGGNVPAAAAELRTKADELTSLCESFF